MGDGISELTGTTSGSRGATVARATGGRRAAGRRVAGGRLGASLRPRPRPLGARPLSARDPVPGQAPAGLGLRCVSTLQPGHRVLATEHARPPLGRGDQVRWGRAFLLRTRVLELTEELVGLALLWLVLNFGSLGQAS